jgi:hypothetical protein
MFTQKQSEVVGAVRMHFRTEHVPLVLGSSKHGASSPCASAVQEAMAARFWAVGIVAKEGERGRRRKRR